MPGPPPNLTRKRSPAPARGDWRSAAGIGWQHGAVPQPPTDLLPITRRTWRIWFGSWWAAHWTPENLPQIRFTIKLLDAFERGDMKVVTELRQWMDGIGVTPFGQQKLRWLAPEGEPVKAEDPADSPYAHLRVAK